MPRTPVVLTPEQRARERSLVFGLGLDIVMIAQLIAAGLVGGSLTIVAEAIRSVLQYLLECFAVVILRQIHRGRLADMEFGTGKLEQVANLLIGASLLIGAAWIANDALRIVVGERAIGTPFGHMLAAISGMLNLYVNLLVWDSVRAAARHGPSVIMEAQVSLRLVKLLSSMFVSTTLTIAALSTDDVVTSWSDAIGSVFVCGVMLSNAWHILRSAIPDLLDRSAGAEVRDAVARGLEHHAADYVSVDRVRSRRSGHAVFVEISLGFAAGLTLADVERRIAAVRATIEREVANAEVAILPATAEVPIS